MIEVLLRKAGWWGAEEGADNVSLLPVGWRQRGAEPTSSAGPRPAKSTLLRSRSFSSSLQMENCGFHCSTLAADSCSAVVSRALLSRRVCSSISHFFTLAALEGGTRDQDGVHLTGDTSICRGVGGWPSLGPLPREAQTPLYQSVSSLLLGLLAPTARRDWSLSHVNMSFAHFFCLKVAIELDGGGAHR